MARKYQSNQKLIHNYGILFNNIKIEGDLSRALEGYGYDLSEINKGEALYAKAVDLYHDNIRKTQQEMALYKAFKDEYDKVSVFFSEDRQKLRILFKGNEVVLKSLRLVGVLSRAISARIDDMVVMYSTIDSKEELKQEAETYQITPEHIASQLLKAQQVRKLYAEYSNVKGDSQQTTTDKDNAFVEVEKWVKKLYSVAKFALKSKPQLLESIGKLVRS